MPFMAIGRAGLLLSLFVYMMSLVGTSVFSGSLRQHCVYSVLPEVKYTALRERNADRREATAMRGCRRSSRSRSAAGCATSPACPRSARGTAQQARLRSHNAPVQCAQSRLCWMGA